MGCRVADPHKGIEREAGEKDMPSVFEASGFGKYRAPMVGVSVSGLSCTSVQGEGCGVQGVGCRV